MATRPREPLIRKRKRAPRRPARGAAARGTVRTLFSGWGTMLGKKPATRQASKARTGRTQKTAPRSRATRGKPVRKQRSSRR